MIYTYSTEKAHTTCVRQYVELETIDAQAMNTFLNKLQDSNFTDKLDQDPNTHRNENLKQFLDTFTHLKNDIGDQFIKIVVEVVFSFNF